MPGILSFSEMASEQDDSIITVVTCEGNISDPDFPYKLSSLVARLRRLLLSADKPFHITNVEPWNSVRVTFNIPREAAQRLRQLAHAGDRVLRDLGILSVQIEGDQVISLTIAGRFNEPQEIILQTTDDDRSRPPSSSSLDVAALEAPVASSSVDPSRKNISQFLSQQAAAGTTTLVAPSSAGQESHFPAPLTAQADFKSPNVVAPGSEPIPFPPKSTPTPPARAAGFGPFPFASMTHAMNTMHSSHHTATTPPQGSSPSRFPFSPPPPYPGGSSIASTGAFQPVRPSSFASSTSTTASATITTASSSASATSPTVVNNLPRGAADRANAALTSPLLVNLLQSDLSGSSQAQHSGGKVFPPPPSEPVAAPKRKRKPRKKEKPPTEGTLGSPGASSTTSSSSCLSSSSLGLPASDSNPHSLFTQPFSIALPTVPSIPLSPSLTPPSISPPSLIGQPLTPTNAMAKPLLTHHFAQHHLQQRVPTLPSPPPTAPPSSASTSNTSGQSSQEAEHELSPWPSPSKRTQHLINPFTGQLEPMSSDEDEGDVRASDQCLEAADMESPCSSLQSNPFSEVGRSNDGMPISRRMSAETMPSPSATESKFRETTPIGTKETPPVVSPPTSPAASAAPGSSTSEKIKLRLKLEPKSRVEKDKDSSKPGEKQKPDGVLSMLQYKVDVSFVNIPSRRTSAEAGSATASLTAVSVPAPANALPLVGCSSVLGSLAGPGLPSGANANTTNMPSEPRVPPLHISLRGRNAAVVTNPRREVRGEGNACPEVKMPRSRSPRGFLAERGGRSAGGVTRTQNPPGRKLPPSRGGGNSRRGRGVANPTTTSASSSCSASAAAIISAVARNAISAVNPPHPALEGRAMAASPPGVTREKTLLSGGSFVLEPGRPARSPPPAKQTAQASSTLQGNGPSDVSSSAVSRLEAESSADGGQERKLPHHQEQQQGDAANAGKEAAKADVEELKEPANPLREHNHGQLTMQQNFAEERSRPSNPAAGKVNLASSELNALLDRPVSPYNPSMTRRNSTEGAKSEGLARPTLAKGMREALATHSMRSKFQNVLSTHQRNVLDERLQHSLEIGFPIDGMPRERLKEALRPDPPKVTPSRRPSRERSLPAATEDGHVIADSQPNRTSPPSGLTVKQSIPEESLPDSSVHTVHESSKETEPTRSSPRLRPEPILRPQLVCHPATAVEMPVAKDRTEVLSGQLGDSGTPECDTQRTKNPGSVCGAVPAHFVKSPTLVTVNPTRNQPDSKALTSESIPEFSIPVSRADTLSASGCAPAMAVAASAEVSASQSATAAELLETGAATESCKAALPSEKTNAAEVCANDLLAVVANDHAAVENRVTENCHAASEPEAVSVKRLAAVSSPDEPDVPLVDVVVSPQITEIRRSSKVSALGPQEKLRLAATGISQLVPAHGGGVLVDSMLPVNQMDGLPEEEGDADAEFGPVESLPHHHLARSTSVAIVTITASPSSASPSGSSPDSLNIGGTSSEENGDQIGSGRNHGDHRGRRHQFPRNQCGSSGSPYEDSGIDSMDAIMEKLPDDSSPVGKREDVAGASNDPLLPASSQQAGSATLTQKSADEAAGSCESAVCVDSESTGINNQNQDPSKKQSAESGKTPTVKTLSPTASSSQPVTSGQPEARFIAPTEETPNVAEKSVDEPLDRDDGTPKGTENPGVASSERTTAQEDTVEDSVKVTTENQDDAGQETVNQDARTPESEQIMLEAVDKSNSDDPSRSSEACDVSEEQQDAQNDTAPETLAVENAQVPAISPSTKMEEPQPECDEPAAEAISMSHHSIIGVSQEGYAEEATNLLASVVFEEQDSRSAEHMAIVTEGDLAEPESPSGPTQLLVFTVEDMDSIMMSENAEHEMSLVQVTPADEDDGTTLEFSALGQSDADRSDGVQCGAPYAACLTAALQSQANFLADSYHSGDGVENCIDSGEGIAVMQVQLEKDPEDQSDPRQESGAGQQVSKTESRRADAVIATAAVIVQVSGDTDSSRELNSEPSPRASAAQMALPNNITSLGGTSHSLLQSMCTNSSLLTVSSGGTGSAVNTTFVQHQQGDATLRSLSPASRVPLKLVSGLNSQMGGVSENGGVVALAHPVSSLAAMPTLPASPVKVVMARVCAAATVTLTTVLVNSPERPMVSGAHGTRQAITSTATVGVYPIVSSTAAAPTQLPPSPGGSMVAPPLVRPTTNESLAAPAPNSGNNTFDLDQSHESSAGNTAISTSRSLVTSRSPGSPQRSRTWLFPNTGDCGSTTPANSTESEHAVSMPPAVASPSPLLGLVNSVPVGINTHFVPLPTSEGNDSDGDTNCSSSSMSSGSGHHHHEDGYSKDDADDMYMGNTSITSGDHNYIFRASRTASRGKERGRPKAGREEKVAEKPAAAAVPTTAENCSCGSSPDRNSVGEASKLEQLSIEIPANEVERRATRSTRSNSGLASPSSGRQSAASQQLSPGANSCLTSPAPLAAAAASDAETEVRTLPNRTAAKRRREDSDSDSERLRAFQNSMNAHGTVAPEKEDATGSKDAAGPRSPANAHVYSKPVKRKCSENAAELIKACIGVDDNPKRAGGGKQHPAIDGAKTAVAAVKNAKPKEDGPKSKGRINASTGEGSEESSDDEVTLSELVTKARSGKAKQVVNNATEERSITRNSKQKQNAKEEDVAGGGKIERVNSRSNSKREDGKGAKVAGAQRESRKEERASSRLGGRIPDKGRKASPQTRGQERSPQRTNHRSRTKEHDRAASPSNPREENEAAGKRKLRSSGSSGYYDSLPQKRRRFSRDNR